MVNKPAGPSSYDMIRRIKRIIGKEKIGHCGTLDPLASGLLVILIGKATKWQSTFMGASKTYRFKMELGLRTNTGDITGEIIHRQPVPQDLTEDGVRNVLASLVGKRQQLPPMFSALKKDGVPLYKLARKGIVVDRAPRTFEIFSLTLLALQTPAIADIRVTCSSGTYVRTLTEDIGRELGTVATMTELVREASGSFQLESAIDGDRLISMTSLEFWPLVKEWPGDPK